MATPKPTSRIGDVFRLAPCLTSEELLVLLALADYGTRIFPSQAALAAKTRLSKRTVSRAVSSLRTKRVIATQSWGKALQYRLDLCQRGVGTDASVASVVRQPDVGPTPAWRRDPNSQINSQPNPGAADAAAGGWEVPDGVGNRIRARDPRADIPAQAKVCRRVMAQHGLTLEEAQRAWLVLCDHWARTGNAAYDTLNRLTVAMDGARDVRAVLLHKLKAVAA